MNLYTFVRNRSVDFTDKLGQKLSPLSVDPDTMSWIPVKSFKFPTQVGKATYWIETESEGSIAFLHDEKGNTYRPTLLNKPCRVFIRGSASANIKVLEGHENDIGDDGLTAIEHEREHIKKFKKHYNNLISDIDWIDDTNQGYRAGTSDKAQKVIDFANASKEYHLAENNLEQTEFDMDSYARNGFSELDREVQADNAKAKAALPLARAAYEKARRDLNK